MSRYWYAIVSFGAGPRGVATSADLAWDRAHDRIQRMRGSWAGTTRILECPSRAAARKADISDAWPVVRTM